MTIWAIRLLRLRVLFLRVLSYRHIKKAVSWDDYVPASEHENEAIF